MEIVEHLPSPSSTCPLGTIKNKYSLDKDPFFPKLPDTVCIKKIMPCNDKIVDGKCNYPICPPEKINNITGKCETTPRNCNSPNILSSDGKSCYSPPLCQSINGRPGNIDRANNICYY